MASHIDADDCLQIPGHYNNYGLISLTKHIITLFQHYYSRENQMLNIQH